MRKNILSAMIRAWPWKLILEILSTPLIIKLATPESPSSIDYLSLGFGVIGFIISFALLKKKDIVLKKRVDIYPFAVLLFVVLKRDYIEYYSTLQPLLVTMLAAACIISIGVDWRRILIHEKKALVYSTIILTTILVLFQFITYLPLNKFITLNGFTVYIGVLCSGIQSLIMFTLLYPLFFALNIEKKRLALLFLPLLAGLVLLNMIRIGSLLLIGAYWSKELAIGIFHTNAMWIIFLGYYYLTYRIISWKSLL